MSAAMLNYHGNPNITIRHNGKLVTDITGLETCTAIFSVPETKWTDLPNIFAAHPVFSYVQMEHREMEFVGGFAVATCDYAGIPGGPAGTLPIYELQVGLSEEPIETHPKFVTQIGGKPSAPLNGAIFLHVSDNLRTNGIDAAPDDNGYVFDSFLVIKDGVLNPFAKIDHYLEASSMIWRKTWNVPVGAAEVSQVGFIDSPDGPAPSLGSGRNWLRLPLTQTRRGGCFQNCQEWRSSGRRGWNNIIYSR